MEPFYSSDTDHSSRPDGETLLGVVIQLVVVEQVVGEQPKSSEGRFAANELSQRFQRSVVRYD